MFGRDKAKSQHIDTLIGAKTHIVGDVRFSGGFHLDGSVKGNVDASGDTNSTLSISDSGVVEGSVAVPYVILSGTVKGDIIAHERIELGASARVTGNVHYGLIEMAIGAEINGKLVHDPGSTPKGSTAKKKPEVTAEPAVIAAK